MSKKLKAKYAIEETVSAVSLYNCILTPDSLKDEEVKKEIKKHNYHHYIILKRPRILLTNIEKIDNNIKYDFCIKGCPDKNVSFQTPVNSEVKENLSWEIINNGMNFNLFNNGKRMNYYDKSSFLFNEL